MAESRSGLFVTFEGVEGAGKSTQIALLRTSLEASGVSVCVTREPGGDAVAEAVRSLLLSTEMDPRTELLLFLAARAQHVEKVIHPALAAGRLVLCDRYTDSSLAYQGYARGLGRDLVDQLNTFATGDVAPDRTFLIDLDPEVGLARQQNRNRMEAETLEFHRRVREGFLREASIAPDRFCVVNGAAPVAEVHAAIVESLRPMLARVSGAYRPDQASAQ